MTVRRTLIALLLVGAGIGCTEPLAPSSDRLVGRWRLGPTQLSPSGQDLGTLEFTADGQYVGTRIRRGVYAQLPADSVSSRGQSYGRWSLAGDWLLFAQDSIRNWDFLSGSYSYDGPAAQAIEGGSTPRVVEVTSMYLTLEYSISPGDASSVPVIIRYARER